LVVRICYTSAARYACEILLLHRPALGHLEEKHATRSPGYIQKSYPSYAFVKESSASSPHRRVVASSLACLLNCQPRRTNAYTLLYFPSCTFTGIRLIPTCIHFPLAALPSDAIENFCTVVSPSNSNLLSLFLSVHR
jgi:hypothetical protein